MLTPQQEQQALVKLRASAKGSCPWCHAHDWSLAEMVGAVPYSPGTFNLMGGAIPILLVVCDKCGYLAQFSAVHLGIVPGQGG